MFEASTALDLNLTPFRLYIEVVSNIEVYQLYLRDRAILRNHDVVRL